MTKFGLGTSWARRDAPRLHLGGAHPARPGGVALRGAPGHRRRGAACGAANSELPTRRAPGVDSKKPFKSSFLVKFSLH